MQRAQIAIEVLNTERPRGTITRLAEEYAVTRQTIYEIGDAGERVLLAGLAPEPHGPQPRERTIHVDRNRLVRSVVALTSAGVSQRGVPRCLAELLDTELSPSWVNGELAKAEAAATTVNAGWHPAVGETLAGDEIYANGLPNLLVVGNDLLYIYALTRQPECDGDTWGCVLLDAPETPQFASDAGKGLAAGAQRAAVAVHQLDWDHLLRPLWGQVARLERQAYAALQAAEARVTKFDQANTPKRLAHHFAAWQRLGAEVEEKIARYDALWALAHQVDAQFALIDLEQRQVRDPVTGAASLRGAGEQLRAWPGRIYEKLHTNLVNWAEALFSYQPLLAAALTPLIERWGAAAIQALACLWQIEADEKRHPLPWGERQARRLLWEENLDTAFSLLGLDQLWLAWDALSQTLNRSWRGSMLAECVNSLLRPVLNGRKHTDQGCLELFRFLHNVQPFARGKRAGYCPAQLVGLDVPDDVLTLLGLAPKVSLVPPEVSI
ncbi:MAG TPA: hypothetical protein PKH77_18910 [Anaerolineae bacterium]|nr:hypothetical protein [Anaerolineae bacterium]